MYLLGDEGLAWGLVSYPVCGHSYEITRVTLSFQWLCLPPDISFPYTSHKSL